jgi:hypothetical protein
MWPQAGEKAGELRTIVAHDWRLHRLLRPKKALYKVGHCVDV